MELLIFTLLAFFGGYYLGQANARKASLPDTATTAALQPAPRHNNDTPETQAAPQDPAQARDTIRILLYFGAFLVIAGAGLFVGLTHLEGTLKTITVLLLALTFYAVGLYIYGRIERLRPAAITFTAIGLVCLPLTGAAAYAFMVNQQSGAIIWLATSALCLLLYILALWRIRQSFIGYLCIFMCLSLWLSIVAVINAPVHFFGWFMLLLGLIYLLAAKFLRLWNELEEPLTISATIMVPVALIATLMFGYGTIGMLDHGITLLLGSVFYAVATFITGTPKERLQYFASSLVLLVLGAVPVALYLSDDWIITSLAVTLLAMLLLAGLAVTKARLAEDWQNVALRVSSLTLVGAAILCAASLDWNALAWMITLHMFVHVGAALYFGSRAHMAGALLALFTLPSLIGTLVMNPEVPKYTLISAYILLGVGLLLTRGFLAGARQIFKRQLRGWYILALVIALLYGYVGVDWEHAYAAFGVAAAVLLASYYERVPLALYCATILGGIGIMSWLSWQGSLHGETVAVAIGTAGILYYLVGKLHYTLPAFGGPWLASGIVGAYLGPIYSFVDSSTNWPGIALLAAAGAITTYEAYAHKERNGVYAGGGVLLLAMQIGLYHSGFHEWLPYWHMWALYFAVLAWMSHKARRADAKDAFTFLALMAQTGPLAWWALQGDINYGLILLLESVSILLVGLLLRFQLVWRWGLTAAVASVLYQLRDYQFFVLVLLGVGVIGLGVFMLLRAEKNKH